MNIAETILQQLGGRKFTVMTGSKNFISDENKLTMKLVPNQSKTKYLTISLNSMDTYDMEFYTINKEFERKVKIRKEGIYSEMLQSTFTEVTGLYTRL
jgi:hypothetical protein